MPFVFLSLLFLILAKPVMAYVGPGLGASAVAAALGVLLGLLMLVVGVVWYPIKQLIRWVRSKK